MSLGVKFVAVARSFSGKEVGLFIVPIGLSVPCLRYLRVNCGSAYMDYAASQEVASGPSFKAAASLAKRSAVSFPRMLKLPGIQ